MEPQRKRRADRHRRPVSDSYEAQTHVPPVHAEDAPPSPDQDASLSQAFSSLGKSSGQVVSALLASGGAAMGKLSEKIQDGSLARDFKRNDVLKQGLIFGLPPLLLLLGSGFARIWLLLGMLAACYYLWRYQLGYYRRSRWDYLLLAFPLAYMISTMSMMNIDIMEILRGRYYSVWNFLQTLNILAPMFVYHVLIFLFAWMRARLPSLLKGVRILSVIGLVVSIIFGIRSFTGYGHYFGFAWFLYPTLTYPAFFVVVLYFCKSRQKENDFTEYQLKPGERWKPVMVLFTMYLGVFGVHRTRLGYRTSARVIRWGLISVIISSVILALITAARSWGAIQFGMVLFYICLAYFLIAALWAFVDIFRILLGNLKPADGSGYAPSELMDMQRQSSEI